jgi:hypothetical protein
MCGNSSEGSGTIFHIRYKTGGLLKFSPENDIVSLLPKRAQVHFSPVRPPSGRSGFFVKKMEKLRRNTQAAYDF